MTIRGDGPLRAGHLILVDFAPVRGTEQDGKRPALVVSETEMHEVIRRDRALSPARRSPGRRRSSSPEGLPAEGAVLVDQVRSIGQEERVLRVLGRAPDTILRDVREKLAALLGVGE
jgi:mRNA interferase MazF